MPQRFDDILFQAVAGGTDITSYVTSAEVTFDLNQRISEATLRLTSWPAGVQFWDTLDVYMGLAVVDEFTHGLLHRFTGFVWDPEFPIWTPSPTMIGKGPLILAERQKVPSDEELEAIGALPPSPTYDAPGIDMSVNPDTVDPADPNSGDPWRDYEAITWVLGKCGLSSRIASIGGLPHYMGLAAIDHVRWDRSESGLSYVEKRDLAGMGFRTHERPPCTCADPTKTIYRTRISMLPDVESVVATFWEGRDLFRESKLKRATSMIRNCVRVEGFNPGNYPAVAVAVGPHPVPPPGLPTILDTEHLSSPLIECDQPPDPQDYLSGLSAQEMADWKRDELCHDWWTVDAYTWRDDPIGPGQTVYINAPKLGGDVPCNQTFWVQAGRISMRPGAFRQDFRLKAPAYWAGSGSILGNLSLGGAIGA